MAQEGDVERALQLWQQCLEITERTDGVEGMQARGAALHSIAEVIAQQGDVEGALQLWQQSLEIKEHVGDLQGKATTLHDMAVIIAQYGDVQRAFQLWQQSLEIKERIGDVKGKGATLFHMGRAVAEQGDVERALQLWQESLAIMESIGDEQGKGANLHHIAEVIARRGDAEQALQLWQESLEIDQRIGNVRGQAATLTSMAWAAGESGDHARRDQLNLQAARALGSVRAYLDMVTVLDNLASSAEQDREIFAAQAAWLVMKVQAPVDDSIGVLRRLFAQAPEGGRLERLIGAAAMIIVTTRGEDHPKHEQLHRQGFEMLSIAAGSAGIQDQEAFEQWLSEGRLTDSAHVFPALLASLEELVGDGWLFDRAPVQEYADSTSVG